MKKKNNEVFVMILWMSTIAVSVSILAIAAALGT
jgi:hypothetical protein